MSDNITSRFRFERPRSTHVLFRAGSRVNDLDPGSASHLPAVWAPLKAVSCERAQGADLIGESGVCKPDFRPFRDLFGQSDLPGQDGHLMLFDFDGVHRIAESSDLGFKSPIAGLIDGLFERLEFGGWSRK